MKAYKKYLMEIFGQERYPDEAELRADRYADDDGIDYPDKEPEIPEEMEDLKDILKQLPELEDFFDRGQFSNDVTTSLDLVRRAWQENDAKHGAYYTFDDLMEDYPKHFSMEPGEPDTIHIVFDVTI